MCTRFTRGKKCAMDESLFLFYPTSSSSLVQHTFFRVLWLPARHCTRMANSIGLSSILSSSRSVITLGTSASIEEEEDESGFEIQLKKYFLNHNQQLLQPCASPSQEFNTSSKEARCSFWIGKHLTASQWENMDQFRAVRTVVVVLHCNTLLSCDIKDALSNIKIVLESNFPEIPCRCIVFSPPNGETLSLSQYSKLFVFVSPEDSIENIGEKIVAGVAAEVAQKIEAKLLQLNAPGLGSTSDIRIPIRTTVDKTCSLNLGKSILMSRCAKIKGDLLLQLGDFDGGMEAYGSTYFSSKVDPLWRSATLESIAACRFQKVQEFLSFIHLKSQRLKKLENERSTLNVGIVNSLVEIEFHMKGVHEEFRRDLKTLKESAIPSSLYKILRQDASSLKVSMASFSSIMQAAREACTSKDDDQESLYGQLNDLMTAFTSTLQSGIASLLKEALLQLQLAKSIFSTSFSDREIEIHLKWMSFYSYCKQQSNFLSEMQTTLQLTVERRRDEIMRRVLLYCVFLCSSCGCYRTAITLLVQLAKQEREKKAYHLAVEAMIYACVLIGVDVSEPLGLPPGVAEASSMLTGVVREMRRGVFADISNSSLESGNTLVKKGYRTHSMFEVLLLNELTDALAEMTVMRSGVLCQLSIYFLFRYHKLLDSKTQKKLIRFASEDSINVPFYHIQESVFPLVTSLEPLPLPPNLAPKSIPVSGPLFTYIDMQRFQLTVLCMDGKKLKNNVIWAVGDVGLVNVVLSNSFKHAVVIRGLTLRCKNKSVEHETGKSAQDFGDISLRRNETDPLCYAVEDIRIAPGEQSAVPLGVMPKCKGTIQILGVECQLDYMGCTTISFLLPQPISVPVMQHLPLVSCINHASSIRMFEGQHHSFTLSVTNCSRVPVEKFVLTAHNETCQLEDCKGCCEVVTANELFVQLDKSALLSNLPLGVAETQTVQGIVHSPSRIASSHLHVVYFRIDYSVNFPPVDPPKDVSSAIPVFGVVPRRVLEIKWPVFLEVGVIVKRFELSYNRRFLAIQFSNLNENLRISLLLHKSISRLLDCEDVLMDPLMDYATPWIKIESIKKLRGKSLSIPWEEVSTSSEKLMGSLVLDFSALASTCSPQQVAECMVCAEICVQPVGERFYWNSDWTHFRCQRTEDYPPFLSNGNDSVLPMSSDVYCTPFSVVDISLTLKSPWRKKKKILCCVSISGEEEMGCLVGPTTSILVLRPDCVAERKFEFSPFSCGVFILIISLMDGPEDSVSHQLYFNVVAK